MMSSAVLRLPTHPVIDDVDEAAVAQLDGDAIGVQRREFGDTTIAVAELAEVGVAEELQVPHQRADQVRLRRAGRGPAQEVAQATVGARAAIGGLPVGNERDRRCSV